MMNHVQIWTLAARPKTLIISVSPVLIGITLAISEGVFHLATFLFTLATALSIQIGTNFANDYFDFLKGADTQERKGPQRILQSGLVSLKAVKRATIFSFLTALISGCYLIWQGGLIIALLLAVAILLGILYTGGPFPLAYLGLGDLFTFIFFGPVAVAGTYYLQTQTFTLEAILAGVAPGAFSAAILTVNNVRDIEEDRKVEKKTLPVRFGKTWGKIEFLITLLLPLLPIFFFYPTHPFALLTTLILLPILPLLRTMFYHREAKELNALFGKTGQLIWLYTLLFCIGWML